MQASTKERGTDVQQQPLVQQLDQEIKILEAPVKVCHKESAERMQEYLLDQANITNDNDEPARATALNQIRNSGRRAEAYRHLKYNRTDTSIQRKITRLEVIRGTNFMAN